MISPDQICWCRDGWVCERHPDQPWPHLACPAGMPCLRAECPEGRDSLRVSILNWRMDLERGNVAPRTHLEANIRDAEARLLAWERQHHDD